MGDFFGISSVTAVNLLKYKAAGVQISCEATPHHLCITDEEVRSLDAMRFKMNPPLRTEQDRQALIEGLRDGTIDCIATDHAPHANEEKEVPYEGAAMGVTGLETAFAAIHTDLILPGVLDLALVVERMAGGAAPFGLERPKSRQHPTERKRGENGEPGDDAEPGDGAQLVSTEPSSASDLKFSSSRTQVMQRISRKTISVGLNGASLRVPETRCFAMLA